MSSIRKKDPKNQFIFASKLLKIAHILLIIAVIFNISYVLLKKPLPAFGDEFINKVIGLFLPLLFFILLYLFVYLWTLSRHIAYNQYAKGELPPIRVKALNDKLNQVLLLISSCTFFVWMLWNVVEKIIEQQNGENSSFVEYLEIAVLVAIIVAFIYDFIRNYRGTFYSLEIRNESLYIFNKEALTDTIPLHRIHHIHFFATKEGKSMRIHPRMQVYTTKKDHILHIKLNIDSYHLLKTFFSRNRVKIIDEYSSRSKNK